ncbi:anaerobic ribonucleoside-triphosphate reductase activating protein [Pseudodesulfovibrio sp. F-1]|uniref:Anaerobic ribonucleoside-triphosphate reductase activating protein n=1 Tax=Pseudodesulfovibrio alkaliphilus TaxID=2661613 RepID=A0A7K1KPX7_9BACT|nr:anaerobic ribonucleoside-triphosphate reductase activating protein [Pseudodesulfovibrio alkaliphilus]MUM77942.1 anaerobic ribonucleoside-triphosphate reductase activating protein [Pseudodesulfovibrio alkaliphilus]
MRTSEPAGAWKYVRGFENLSLCDWPGRHCCILFLGGCNLRCPTCHNAVLAWDMHALPAVDPARIKTYLRDRAGWLDGVTITGGEPTATPYLAELLLEVRKCGLPVKLDTNGMRPDVVQELLELGLVDVFAVDVKGPYAAYPALTGHAVSEIAARANLERIFAMAEARPGAFYFRITRVPALTDGDIATARGYLPQNFTLTLQDYVPPKTHLPSRRKSEHAQPDHEERRPVGNVVN